MIFDTLVHYVLLVSLVQQEERGAVESSLLYSYTECDDAVCEGSVSALQDAAT